MGIEVFAYAAFFLTMALTYAIICLGLNLQWGQTGLFNVGIAAFVAVGAYTSAILTTPEAAGRIGGFGLPMLVGWGGAVLVAGLLALFVGWLTIRLRADYLAITTFGVAVLVQLAVLNLESVTGGPFGIGFIPKPFEEDEIAAQALGKNPKWLRIQAFAIGGAIMGLGGAVQAHFIGFIAPENYLPMLTFQVWAMLIVGGSGNNRGAILGAVLVWGVWAVSATFIDALFPSGSQARAASLQIVLIGVALCAILMLRPQGILREIRTVSRHALARRAKREVS